MSSFLIPSWVIKRIDKIRRDFLWGKSENRRGISLINWEIVCHPREYGGMGGANLMVRNKSLLLRWWWRMYRNPNSLWTQSVMQLYNLAKPPETHRIWMRHGSFFWLLLLKLRPHFDWSVTWNIAQGSSISYWFDSWSYPTMISQFTPEPCNRKYSLQMAISSGLCQVPQVQEHAEDRVVWLWTRE